MQRFLQVAGLALFFTHGAFAADAPKPAETPISMSLLDVQVSAIAIQNAGAACDAGVKAYCQIVVAREGTLVKLGAAAQTLQQPAPAGK